MNKAKELLEKYCERIEKELGDLYKNIEKSDTMPPATLEVMDKLLHSMKSVKTTLAMIEYDRDDDGYSGKYYSYDRHYPQNGYSGRSDDYSGRRMSRGYSRDSEKHDMIRKLEDMMARVRTDEEAMAIQDTLDVLNRMN